MSTAKEAPSRWRKRLLRFMFTSTLMGIAFTAGVAITAFIAVRMLFPIAATGMTMGLMGLASASASATINALYSGDSETRLTVLTGLKQSFDSQPTQSFDAQTAAWILPAIEHCQTDGDPDVVALAEELAGYVKDRTLPPPNQVAFDIGDIAKNYIEFKLMTPEPVFVNPELAMLCVGATKEMVDSVRIDDGPHANCAVNIFMNELAAEAFQQATQYPVGSIIVKEKQMLGYRTQEAIQWNGAGNGVGGMIKRENGFDASHGNWEYFYVEDDDEIEFGKMNHCIECHEKAKNSDYVFGHWSKRDDGINKVAPEY